MKRIIPWLLGFFVMSVPLWADAPARAGRLSLIDGAVSFSAGGGDSWETATLNYPLSAGDRLSTAESARAEAHIGSTAVRLAPDSAITFEALDDQAVQVRLDKGSMSVRVRRMDPDQRFEVDTQTSTISIVEPGSYRVDQRVQGDAKLTVHEGDARVTTGADTFHVISR